MLKLRPIEEMGRLIKYKVWWSIQNMVGHLEKKSFLVS